MLLAVAGLDAKAVKEHTRALAVGDWSRFPPAEQAALGVARTLATRTALAARDFQGLADQLGRDRAADVVWWVCHCHYMMCVADALQLPLESTNVFDGFAAEAPPSRTP